jgi:integrase
LDKIGFHTPRHTFASQKLQGINYKGERIKPLRIEVIAEVMGHRDTNVTKKIYAKHGKDILLLEFIDSADNK